MSAPPRRLPVIQCPSVGTHNTFEHEACTPGRCGWWDRGCTAQASVAPFLRRRSRRVPACALAESCRWHRDAVRSGASACVVRLSGELCEHQGGDYNTFHFD